MSSDLKASYSDHATARMFDRGIFDKQVRRTLRRPHRMYAQAPHKVVEYTTTSQVIIRVIYLSASSQETPVVVSAVRLGKLNDAYQRSEHGIYLNTEFDIAYIALRQGEMAETVEVKGGIICDLDRHGDIMGIEVFDLSCHHDVEKNFKSFLTDISTSL